MRIPTGVGPLRSGQTRGDTRTKPPVAAGKFCRRPIDYRFSGRAFQLKYPAEQKSISDALLASGGLRRGIDPHPRSGGPLKPETLPRVRWQPGESVSEVEMPIILVVDDSPTDQKLVGGLLNRDFDWIIEYANNGRAAVEMMEQISPDLIITDLLMPEMDGMQFCREAQKKAPHIPVVLITGQGSEHLAVEALGAGAASYVPKSALAESLLETVEQLLALAARDRSKDRLMTFTTNLRHQFKLENDPLLIPPLLDFIKESMQRLHLGNPAQQRQVAVAVEEALLNAMLHGNLELPQLTTQDARQKLHEGKVSELVEDRRKTAPFDQRRVLIGVDLSHTKAQFVIRDQGNGFDAKSLLAPDDPHNIASMNGRGLTLIRNFMDEVAFNETGNEIRMTLNVHKPAAASI
jgi:CheY-like chemotaxis protein/anti-sigma regulatory factor (Ser/Thr protein kinase)